MSPTGGAPWMGEGGPCPACPPHLRPCSVSASQQLVIEPDDIADKRVHPDEVPRDDVGAPHARPRALLAHPRARRYGRLGSVIFSKDSDGCARMYVRFSVRLMPATNSPPGTGRRGSWCHGRQAPPPSCPHASEHRLSELRADQGSDGRDTRVHISARLLPPSMGTDNVRRDVHVLIPMRWTE